MKISMVSGSPKSKDSCSQYLMDELSKMLEGSEVSQYSANHPNEETMEGIYASNAVVFVFPLYVDALPSQLISFLLMLETYLKQKPLKDTRVYAICNCGFFEGEQNRHALDIIRNFSLRAGLRWEFGIGMGAGPFIGSSQSIPWQASIKKPVYQAMLMLKSALETGKTRDENLFVTAKMPRLMYMLAGNMGWRSQAKANVLKIKDLKNRLQ